MRTGLSFQDGMQFGWDSTSLTLADTCLRKYKYKMIEGWQPFDKSVHLLFGGWYASALEMYHKLRAEGFEYREAVREVVKQALFDSWIYDRDEAGDVIPDTGKAWISPHNTKTRENLIRTIVWYLDQFQDDPASTVILSNGKAATELSIALPVDDGIIFSGHFDRLVEYAHEIYVQDQKTTGSTIGPQYFAGYSPDIQMSMYSFLGKAAYSMPVTGVMIDAAQIAVGFTRFERGFAFRSAGQLNEWYDEAMLTVHRARRATAENEFPMNRTACGNYGGCEFRSVCARSPEVRLNFLKASFTQSGDAWDPLKSR